MVDVCRLCMGKRSVDQQIFGKGGLYQQIRACLPVKVSESDSLPKKVCRTCAKKVKDIYLYCQKTVNVQRQLLAGNEAKLDTTEDEEHSTLKYFIKEEPPENTSGKVNNGVIVFRNLNKIEIETVECTSKCPQTKDSSSKSPQIELKSSEKESTRDESIINELENDKNIDLSNCDADINHCDLEKPEIKVKVEEINSEDLLFINNDQSLEDVDQNYSSDDDLALSSITFKNNESKNDFVKERRTRGCPKQSDTKKDSSKHIRKDNKKAKNTEEKVKNSSTNNKDILSARGDEFFYPKDTAEELKKWQCLMCFAFVQSRSDLLLHYKEHLKNPSKFVPKAHGGEEFLKPLECLESSQEGITGHEDKKSHLSGKAKLGVEYIVVNNPDFGDSTAFQCLKCLKMFLNKRDVVRHLICHDDTRPFPCNMCGRSYKRAYELLLHGRVHNGFKTLACKYPGCSYKTVYRGALHNHIKRHEVSGVFKYNCEICHKGFDVLTWYNEHKNVHLGQKPFTCDVCGKGFAYSRYLSSHRRSVHPDAEAKSGKQLFYRCPSCPCQFTFYKRLKSHIKKVHDVREPAAVGVLCDICGKGLSGKEHLKLHRRTHTGEKPHVCRTCGKGFIKKCNLTLHERVHSGEKPHVCSHCGKAFSQRSTLVVHERYHSGARPYVCSLCNKGFVAKGLLSMHLKTSCI